MVRDAKDGPGDRRPRRPPKRDGENDRQPRAEGRQRPARRDGERGRDPRAGGRRPSSGDGRNDRQSRPDHAERPDEPEVDPSVTGKELDDEIRDELSGLSAGAASAVAKHLVMAGMLLEGDPEAAYAHALAARRRAARIGVVREAVGMAAYTAGKYAEALAELRAARRMTGSAEYLPVMADCERGLGRPRRALDLAGDPAVGALDVSSRVEMLIVAAGARRDLGEDEAAVVSLQVPELRSRSRAPWVARLRYAYADALVAVGRVDEARRWFMQAAEADVDDETDAEERAHQLGAGDAG